jgi:hypothetical protein
MCVSVNDNIAILGTELTVFTPKTTVTTPDGDRADPSYSCFGEHPTRAALA